MAYVLYEGPSELDGQPVVALVSGIDTLSVNGKTGPMAQVWYMSQEVDPFEAIRTGKDASVCGDCPARGDGSGKGRYCYVPIARGPYEIWTAWKEGGAKPIPKFKDFWKTRKVRFGAYGDPAAVPTHLTENIAVKSAGFTGYTHAWRHCDQRLRHFLMASVESGGEKAVANLMGWSTFRIKRPDDDRLEGEGLCPGSAEGGKVLNCFYCLKCAGSGSRDTVVNVHGTGRRHFQLIQESL